MIYHGQILNGLIVLDGNPTLPEGARIEVVLPEPEVKMIQVPGLPWPVVGCDPNVPKWFLTNSEIAELWDEEDAASFRR